MTTPRIRPIPLYTAAQVRAIDACATGRFGIAAEVLMQRAAQAAFDVVRRRWPAARRLTLLAGGGNNGGDALLLGVLARTAGLEVDAVVCGEARGREAVRARLAFVAAGGRVLDAGSPLPPGDVVVDGLFGSGLSRPIEGAAATLVGDVAGLHRPVLALDLPSGLDPDRGIARGPCIRADATVCFVAWKRGLFTADGPDACGTLELAMLDVPPEAYGEQPTQVELMQADTDALPAPRPRNSDKSRFGHVLAIGGDAGMAGAIRMTGEASLRCGAGLVSIATRGAHLAAINAARPELMAHAVEHVDDLVPLLARATVVAIGPGLGRGDWGRALLDAALASGKPLVLDADALNLLAANPRVLPPDCVLTPHPGEAARLLACDVAAVQGERFAAAGELARRHGAIVVLKGAGSLVAAPEGRIAVCPWGNPGMASGGMGDLLTGVIAALRAQHLSAWDAACTGVALHARAGDAAAQRGGRGMIASDLLSPLRRLVNGADA